jgi:hypothetical protein
MATLLADSPPAPPDGQAQPGAQNGAPAEPPAASAPVPSAHGCKRCGAELAAGQDWCLQCGAGAPGSLGMPSWRPAATVFAIVAALVLGAAAAAVAALSNGSAKAPAVTTTVAAAPTASTPATTGAATVPGTSGATPEAKSQLPSGTVTPPKIPLTASTPKASETAATTTPSSQTTASTPTTGTTPTSPSGASGEKANEESQQAAILLDPDAATTYDPYEYPASEFSGPNLAIDDDPSTAWTAEVNPATAPKMAEGLLIDLKDKQKVAVLELITSTPGMIVQVYGAKGQPAPSSITDPRWTPLSAPKLIKKKRTRLALRDPKKQFTYVTLWISKAPTSAAGTTTTPAHVAVNEVELFPPKS